MKAITRSRIGVFEEGADCYTELLKASLQVLKGEFLLSGGIGFDSSSVFNRHHPINGARIAILDQIVKLDFVRYVAIDDIAINDRVLTASVQVETNNGERIEAII